MKSAEDAELRGLCGCAPRALPLPGFSSLEYAVLIAIAAAAFVGMSLYTMRAASGRWRQVGDVFGYGRGDEPQGGTGGPGGGRGGGGGGRGGMCSATAGSMTRR